MTGNILSLVKVGPHTIGFIAYRKHKFLYNTTFGSISDCAAYWAYMCDDMFSGDDAVFVAPGSPSRLLDKVLDVI